MAAQKFTRQMATILSIDAVAYSQMMSADDEAALLALNERSRLISQTCARYGGRMFGMAGDSLMAEFGNPVDAVRAAVSFQGDIEKLNAQAPSNKQMAFRVGINTGDVIADGELLFGHDVNIAARLQERARANGIMISRSTMNLITGKTAYQFQDMGAQELKNIREPVIAFSLSASRKGTDRKTPAGKPSCVERRGSGPPPVTVLPFINRTEESDLDYLGDALAEDLIQGLSNMRWFPVIAHASSSQFNTADITHQEAARALGARYVVHGKVTRVGDKLCLTVMLEDVDTNRIMLSRRYERSSDSARNLQDEVGAELVSAFSLELDMAEQRRSFYLPWEDLETWQLVARGRFHMARRTSVDTRMAQEYFQKALEQEPASSNALSELAWWNFWQGFVTMQPEYYDRVLEYSNRALFMDSQDARPHAYIGATHIMLRDPAEARNSLKTALHINPSFSFAASCFGSTLSLLGNYRQGLDYLEMAERLNPFDLYQFHNLGEMAAAWFAMGEYEQCITQATRSLGLSPGYWYSRLLLAGSLARVGRMEEAREQRAILLERRNSFKASSLDWLPFQNRDVVRDMHDAWEMAASAPD